MIKFGGISEVSKNQDTNISKGYENIHPAEYMSDQEVIDFWNLEFKNAQKKMDIDSGGLLVSEVINCFESDIDIKFDMNDAILSSLKKFDTKVWNQMHDEEKITAIKELVQEVGNQLEIKHLPEIIVYDGAIGNYGAYHPDSNIISLNKIYFNDPKEMVDTVTHELRHAYQHMRAEILETYEDALYKVNFENYISPVHLPAGGCLYYTDYMDQYVEVDARVFANLFTETMK